MFELPKLPYEMNALEPYISQETLEFHYGKHHQTYVNNLNNLTQATEYETMSLEEVISHSKGGLFNNAAQVWNHTFYWNGLSPNSQKTPSVLVEQLIVDSFGSFEKFVEEFSMKATTNFASGWTWLAQNGAGKLEIINTDDADTLAVSNEYNPLLVLDVWEHAYYIDYRNARPKYIENFWNLVNWEFVEGNLK